jgi:beta-N-acetylhexosaminidase
MDKRFGAQMSWSVLLFSWMLMTSLTVNAGDIEPPTRASPYLEKVMYSPWVDSVFSTLSLEQKVAQLLMVEAYSNRDAKHQAEVSELVSRYQIGGVIFFQGGPEQQARQTNYYQSISRVPLLIAIDGEWGLGMRLDSTMSFPRQMVMGAIGGDSLEYLLGKEIARQLKLLGIHINFAPVVDINNNPSNPVINTRSFGENKYNVTNKSLAYARGMQDHGVLASAKHFPGHGDTNIDSHYALPVIRHSRNRLDSIELYPFARLIEQGIASVMVAHLHIPSLDSSPNLASTLSSKVITGLLRDSLDFSGLVFTDALNMKGVSAHFKTGDLELRALQAGNDVLLMPGNVPLVIHKIVSAIDSGKVSLAQVELSCRRVLAAKYMAGLDKYTPVDIQSIRSGLNTPGADYLRRKIVESSLVLLLNQDELIPLKRLDTTRVATLLVADGKPGAFQERISSYLACDHYTLHRDFSIAQFDSLLRLLSGYNLVIVGVGNTNSLASRKFGITDQSVALVDSLMVKGNMVLCLFAGPYALARFGDLSRARALVLGQEDTPMAQDYTAQLLFGAIGAGGFLPVTVNEQFFAGNGMNTNPGARLKYTVPEELGIDSYRMLTIDSMVQNAIDQGAMPGCQVVFAKDGKVFYQKSFGYHTYQGQEIVNNNDLYDIASITKIAATVPAVMKMHDTGQLKIRRKLSEYLPHLEHTNKHDIRAVDILTHQARLAPYISFHFSTMETIIPDEKMFSSRLSDSYPFRVADRMYMNRNTRYKPGYYSDTLSEGFTTRVADNLYIVDSYKDSILRIIDESEMLKKKEYKYSDLGFYYLHRATESITGVKLEQYLDSLFFKPLGMKTMGFRPLERFSSYRVAPTENDVFFRRQLVHGHVHDQGTAMLGGVCGHAGLFSNANDLAILMQLYLNKGIYGGERYFEEQTVDYFTTAHFKRQGNRRGLGFDKPEMDASKPSPAAREVSAHSFGHSGFTGTYTWADPDNGLLYVFLSNRVHPDALNGKLVELNLRTSLHQAVIDLFK